jgi:RNA polymerase sigma-70 factor (ECF subfamily)
MRSFNVLANERSHEERMEDALEPRAFSLTVEHEAEDALIAEAALVDAAAFGILYERYYPRVYRYVFHRVGNTADSEDITALVFMKALEGLSSYQPGRSGFAPWLFRITRNSVVDHYRRARRQVALEEAEHHEGSADPSSAVLGAERVRELRDLMLTLSPEQREVVLLRYSAELSFAEIAATLKKREPAVRMLLHRGLRKLQVVMSNG